MFTRDKFTPLDYEAIAPTTSTGLTVPSGAAYALITTAVQDCRFTDDGTTPTLTVGNLIKVGDPPFWYAGDLSKVKLFNAVAGALVKVLYYK